MKNRILLFCKAILLTVFNINAQTLVKDINTADASSDPKEFLTIGTKTYFSANDGKTGNELWVTDGTDAGTKLVKDIMTGDIPSGISNLTNLNGLALFWYSVNGNYGIYKSDGTAAGTIRVTNTDTPFYFNYQNPSFTVFGNNAYFNANGFLWKTDGTAAGTVKLLQGNSFGSLYGSKLAEFNGKLYCTASATGGDGLWQTDGTTAGTKLVKKMNLNLKEIYNRPVVFKNKLYFIAATIETGFEIWASDGTDAGTVLVKDIYNDPQSNDKNGAFHLHSTLNSLFFVGRIGDRTFKLWKSDGTSQGTVAISTFNLDISYDNFAYYQFSDYQFRGFEFKNKFYFFSRGSNSSVALYESDGTELGTKYVHGVDGSVLFEKSQFAYLVTDSLIFYNNASGFGDLAATNGTPTGNRVVKQITKETGISARATFFARAGNSVLFSASYKNIGQELWKTNGTEAGTVLLKNINLKSEGSFAGYFTKVGNNVLFLAYDENDGFEAWKTDGTTSGTQRITSTYPGISSYFETNPPIKFLERDNKLFFTLYDTLNGREIRYFDNTLSKINLL
jgi:ELWxxDGT repeat protein